jgi:DNA-binding Xre family transcriptional regulator
MALSARPEANGRAPLSSLGEFITQRMNALDLSYRQVAERSGGLVSHAQVHHLASGKGRSQGITEDVLEGLCKALRCRPADILDRLDVEVGVIYESPPEADFLTAEQRRIVDSVIRALVAKKLPGEPGAGP